MSFIATVSFGDLLKQLRKRAGMTQGDLAAALGYSVSLICALEQNRRLPDLDAVIQRYIPALTLQEEPHLAVGLPGAAFFKGDFHAPAPDEPSDDLTGCQVGVGREERDWRIFTGWIADDHPADRHRRFARMIPNRRLRNDFHRACLAVIPREGKRRPHRLGGGQHRL